MGDDTQAEIMLAGRLDGRQRNRLKRLLNMMYKPAELAEDVGFNTNQVYMVYIPAGCPYDRDQYRHLWINGKAFKEWYEELYKKRTLQHDQAFCLTCKKAVKMLNPVRKIKDGLIYDICECPNCGRKLSRIIDYKRGINDQS